MDWGIWETIKPILEGSLFPWDRSDIESLVIALDEMSLFRNADKRSELGIDGLAANELLEQELEFERMVKSLEILADEEDGEDGG